jgi:hypothetical protein
LEQHRAAHAVQDFDHDQQRDMRAWLAKVDQETCHEDLDWDKDEAGPAVCVCVFEGYGDGDGPGA